MFAEGEFYTNVYYDCILTWSVRLPRGAPLPPNLRHHSQAEEKTGGKAECATCGKQAKELLFYKKVFQEQRTWGLLSPTGHTRSHLVLINGLHRGPGCTATPGKTRIVS